MPKDSAQADSEATGAKAPQAGVAAMLVAGMALFVLGIQEGPNFGWSSPLTIGSIIVGFAILCWIAWQQWRSNDPLIDIRQIARPGIGGDLALLALLQFSLIGLVLYGTMYLQNVLGFAPLVAGAASLPLILGLAVGAQVGGRLFDKGGVRGPLCFEEFERGGMHGTHPPSVDAAHARRTAPRLIHQIACAAKVGRQTALRVERSAQTGRVIARLPEPVDIDQQIDTLRHPQRTKNP